MLSRLANGCAFRKPYFRFRGIRASGLAAPERPAKNFLSRSRVDVLDRDAGGKMAIGSFVRAVAVTRHARLVAASLAASVLMLAAGEAAAVADSRLGERVPRS